MKNILFAISIMAICGINYSCTAPKTGKNSSSSTKTPTDSPTNPSAGTTPTEDAGIGKISTETLVNFYVTDQLTAVMEKAKREKKVVFLDFYTTWCAPCRMMDQSVFRDEDVAAYMNQNCINMKINAEKGEGVALKLQYNVNAYPSYIFINADGDEVLKKEGSLSIEDFKKLMKTGVWKVKNPAGNP